MREGGVPPPKKKKLLLFVYICDNKISAGVDVNVNLFKCRFCSQYRLLIQTIRIIYQQSLEAVRFNIPPNGGQSYDIASVSCGQTSRGAGGVVRNYTERGDAPSIYIINIAHALCR
jgi:hypothetical protein